VKAQLLHRRDLTLAYVASLVVALIMSVASIAGLTSAARVYAGIDLSFTALFMGQDALNLVVALPILLGAMWLSRRGSLIGFVLWPGALFYVLYDYGYYVLGAPFNALFLIYIALMTLSTYAMIAVLVSLDATAVRDQLTAAIRPRLIGGFLAGLAVLFTALWTALVVSALVAGTEFGTIPRVVTTLDLTIQLPALFVGGVLLIRRHPLGFLVAPGLLLQASAYLAGLSAITVLQERLLQQPFDAVAVVPGVLIGVIGLAMIGSFVRAAARPRSADPTGPRPALLPLIR
jgi:hypothetical protein